MAHTRPSQVFDVHQVAQRMREEDVAELRAANGVGPHDGLIRGFCESSLCLTIVHNDQPIGMCGVRADDHYPELGYVWLLATPDLPKITRDFVRQTPAVLAQFHKRYPVLTNLVDERNAVHIRWLQRVGFTFINRHPQAGFEQRPFLEFIKLCADPLQSL